MAHADHPGNSLAIVRIACIDSRGIDDAFTDMAMDCAPQGSGPNGMA
jgi:hypothetical protein